MILIPMILIVGILEYGMDCFLYLIGLEVGLGMPCIRLIIIQQGIMFGGG